MTKCTHWSWLICQQIICGLCFDMVNRYLTNYIFAKRAEIYLTNIFCCINCLSKITSFGHILAWHWERKRGGIEEYVQRGKHLLIAEVDRGQRQRGTKRDRDRDRDRDRGTKEKPKACNCCTFYLIWHIKNNSNSRLAFNNECLFKFETYKLLKN